MVSEGQQHLPLARDILLQEGPLKALDTKIVGWGKLVFFFPNIIYLNKYIYVTTNSYINTCAYTHTHTHTHTHDQ